MAPAPSETTGKSDEQAETSGKISTATQEVKTIYIIKTNLNLDHDSIKQLLIAEDILKPDSDFSIRKETGDQMHSNVSVDSQKLFVAVDDETDTGSAPGNPVKQENAEESRATNQGNQKSLLSNKTGTKTRTYLFIHRL